ncbi:MAG: anthranilate synthase component I [Fimbriiglobus sp.]
MRYRPALDEFAQLAKSHTVVPVYRRIAADDLTPVSAYAKIREASGGFLFESVVGTERVGRYSFLGSSPFQWFEAYGQKVRTKTVGGAWVETTHPDPLKLFEETIAAFRSPVLPGLPRFLGGAVGHAAYDTIRYIENLPNAPTDDRGIADLSFAFYDRMLIFDHIYKTIHVVVMARTPAGADPQVAYQVACDRVDELVHRLSSVGVSLPISDIAPEAAALKPGMVSPRYTSNFAQGGYQDAVKKAKEYILAGDAFQIVLSQRFRTETTAKPFDIYRALRIVNPSPFMFFVEGGPATLIGASPEIMCRVENNEMTVRPLAGTRPRGKTVEEDRQLAIELVNDPKERAEHIMLVDLARNDVGRVAKIGSVRIQDLLQVERYSHVMHLSSTVVGELAEGRTPFDAMRSALPAGTLSGAPKVRAMEIIDELEPHRRGPYGGAIGYVDYCGNTDTCIALRTMVLTGTTADIQAGAGLVADSDPDMENQETINKAMSLMRALEVAETQLS